LHCNSNSSYCTNRANLVTWLWTAWASHLRYRIMLLKCHRQITLHYYTIYNPARQQRYDINHTYNLSPHFENAAQFSFYVLCVRCEHVYTLVRTLVDYLLDSTWSYIDINLHNWQSLNWLSRHPVNTDSASTKYLFYIISKSAALMFYALMCIPWDINIARSTGLVLHESFQKNDQQSEKYECITRSITDGISEFKNKW
jgi:hypothetical protein